MNKVFQMSKQSTRLLVVFKVSIIIFSAFTGFYQSAFALPAIHDENQTTFPWTMLGHDPARTFHTESSGPDTLQLIWRYETQGYVTSSAAIVGGRIFIGSEDGCVYCLEAKTGVLVWSYETKGGKYLVWH